MMVFSVVSIRTKHCSTWLEMLCALPRSSETRVIRFVFMSNELCADLQTKQYRILCSEAPLEIHPALLAPSSPRAITTSYVVVPGSK